MPGPVTNPGEPLPDGSALPPGRRLVIPLNICVLPGLSFINARLLSMEIPAHVGANHPKPAQGESGSTGEVIDSKRQGDRFMKIDPYRGSWGLRFLELELSNPTDVVFEVGFSVQLENNNEEDHVVDSNGAEYPYPKTRIDRDYSARLLIPLEHFKLPVLDGSFLVKDSHVNGTPSNRSSSFSEKNIKAELNASIKDLISRIKVRWQSGRNSLGELNIKDATQAVLQSSMMDVLLPDPLTFGFRLAKSNSEDSPEESGTPCKKSSIFAHDMTPMEVLVRNNTKDLIRISLCISCRDVAGENCFEGEKATVLWAGLLYSNTTTSFRPSFVSIMSLCVLFIQMLMIMNVSGGLSGISLDVPPLEEMKHTFSLYFLVPGEYTLLATAVIDHPNEILRARAKSNSLEEPIFCRGPPFHVQVNGTV